MAGQIRIGVVGVGSFGAHHARHYAGHPAAVLAAVADADLARARDVAEKYGAAAHAGHRALIGLVDAVSVTVPASLHHTIAGDLIDAGIHVFVEKPLAANAAEAADLVTRAGRAGVVLQVGHIERFSPAFRALAERVTAPRLIECVRRAPPSSRSTDVDVVLDLMIHDIDLALTLAGAPVAAVEATGASVRTAFNDNVEARLTFGNGVVAELTASRVAARAERTVSVGEAGRLLIADLGAPSLAIVTGNGDAARTETVPVAAADALADEIDAFIDSVATGTPPLCGGKAGLDAVRVADMILAAIARARPVPLPAAPLQRRAKR